MSWSSACGLAAKAAIIVFMLLLWSPGEASAACGGDGQRHCKIGFDCKKGYAPKGDVCRPCGRKDQPACEPMRTGAQCLDYTENVNGTCRRRGKQGDLPYSKGIFKCAPGYALGSNDRCTACSGVGQPACEAARKGKRCDDGLKSVDGICSAPKGSLGQPPRAKSLPGFPCDKGLADDNGACQPCGKAGQVACHPMRSGPRCVDYTQEDDGRCVRRGREGEDPYVGIGFDCAPGFNVGSNGKCTACGGVNQISCEVMRRGSRCEEGYRKIDGVCRPDVFEALKDKSKDTLKDKASGLVGIILEAINRDQDEEVEGRMAAALQNRELRTKNASGGSRSAVRLPTANEKTNIADLARLFDDGTSGAARSSDRGSFCTALGGRTFTLGASVAANLVRGMTFDGGLAFPCDGIQNSDGDLFKWYASSSIDTTIGGGGSAGLTLGVWSSAYDDLAGPSHGLTFGLGDALDTLKGFRQIEQFMDALEDASDLSDMVGVSVSVSLWYERTSDTNIGAYQGMTITISKGAGLDAGYTYSKATTSQAAD